VTQSLVGLVGAVGNAFVQLGSTMDISGVIDTITAAINNMTPAFQQIGTAATPVFEQIITIIGRMVEALGPQVSAAITAFSGALSAIDWEAVVKGVALFIKGLTDIVTTATGVADTISTTFIVIGDVFTGNFSEADAALQGLKQRQQDMMAALKDTSGVDAAINSVKGLNDAVKGHCNARRPGS
jgi:phage-related protein